MNVAFKAKEWMTAAHTAVLSRFTGKPPALWGVPFLSVRLLRKSRSSVSYPTTGGCSEEAMIACEEP
jgi:hypothetical protein